MATKIFTLESLKAYSSTELDFAFELKVLNQLREVGINCTHTGAYDDPNLEKPREFDIRAEIPGLGTIHLAIECKNIRADSGLVVNCVRRQADEAFHEIIINAGKPVSNGRSYCDQIRDKSSLYKIGDWVGKALAQVDPDGKELRGTVENPNFYDKYNQAVQSAASFVRVARELGDKDSSNRRHLILPVVVVPNDRLWMIKHSEDGGIVSEPSSSQHLSYKLLRRIENGHINHTNVSFNNYISYTMSHLEILTIEYLPKFVNSYLDRVNNCSSVFPKNQDE